MDYANSAVWSSSYKNNLPDSAFLYIEPGGKKDKEGKTTPRSLRHFPYKDLSGKIDVVHLRNAIARIPIAAIPKGLKKPLQDKARKLLKDSKKKSKSNLFVSTLNKICAQNFLTAEVQISPKAGPCCSAFDFWRTNNFYIKYINDLYFRFVEEEMYTDPEKRKRFVSMYAEKIHSGVNSFMSDYCKCKNYGGDPSVNFDVQYLGVDQANVEPPSRPINQQLEDSCANLLNTLIGSSANPLSMVDLLDDTLGHTSGNVGVRAAKKYLENFAKCFNLIIDYVRMDAEANLLVRTDTFKNFMDDMCKLMDSQPLIYMHIMFTTYQMSVGPFLKEAAEKEIIFLTNHITKPDSDSIAVRCPPSPNDNSIVALAAALGVTTAVAALAYNAITRGKTKKCSDVATASSRLTPLIIAAVGGSFATTQTSEATVQEKLQAVMQKECEGRLPYSCGEGGFEGPDEGDGSGEVDAPGGGGIGEGLL